MTDLYGVDVASWQGPPGDWTGPAGRISWAAVKITEYGPGDSRYIDPDAVADLAYLSQKRLGRIFYLYAHPATDPAATVAFFVSEARRLGITDHDGVMLDHETTDGKTPAEVSAWAQAVLAGLERELDRLPLLYSYPDFIESGNCAGCEKYPLWISDPNHPAGHPVVPRPWKMWAIHQYSTAAPIDRDLAAYTSLREMQAALGKRGAVPVHRVPPKPAKPKKHVVKKAAGKGKTVVKQEPVMTAASANSAIAAAVVWWAHHLGLHWTVTQQHAILTIVTALAGMAAAAVTRPVRVTAFFTALGTAATAASAFGLHFSPQLIAGEMPLIMLALAGILRGHVSPSALLADAQAAVSAPWPSPTVALEPIPAPPAPGSGG